MDNHTYQKFDQELSSLNNSLMQLSGIVEIQLQHIQELINTGSSEIFDKMTTNEDKIDDQEIEIDNDCARIIALRQPAASDLRRVLSISRSVRDLERMGDEALLVAERLISIYSDSESRKGLVPLKNMGEYLIKSLNGVLDAFSRSDVQLAIEVVRLDEAVDEKIQRATREMITYMMEDPSCISHVLNVLGAFRSLERISDHINNIAEQLIYSVEGIDVRHKSVKEMRKSLLGNN